jgi:Protein of unknown function (DUF3500)/5'-nucleotidase, C-terminal domain
VNRRAAIKFGASLGVMAGSGIFAGYEILPPRPSRELEPVDTLARRLYTSLTDEQRADTCVAYDHPLRQYHNRGVWGGGRAVLFGFNRRQRQILTDLLHSGLSAEGRDRLPEEDFLRWSGVESMRVLICGDPTSSAYQIIMTATHLNLRLGGKSREGAAFGGPQIYGDQRGNNRVGLPGNVYRDQFLLAQRLFRNLDAGRQKQALVAEAPVQTGIELQGRSGSFAGIPISDLKPEDKALTRDLIDGILATYPPADVAFAHECIKANGGADALFLSYYQHGEDGDIPDSQVFRLEGPGAVFYFRGFPHVHAFLNVAMDGDSPLSAGEPLGTNPAWLDRAGVKALFESAMRSETKADLAYYDEGSVAGRLRKGMIRSGDIYSLESWQERVAVVDVKGANLSAPLLAQLRDRRVEVDANKIYKVATTSYIAADDSAKVGRIDSKQQAAMLRDVTVAYLRSHGFTALT